MQARVALVLVALAAPLLGCVESTDDAIFVEMGLGTPSLTLTVGSLATKLDGDLELSLHLGANADATSQVTFESAWVVDAAGNELVAPLYLAATPAFPLALAPETTVVVDLVVDGTQPPLEDAEVSALCAADVRIGVVLRDSRQANATPLSSEAFRPSGCP
jgi:hypothetical protein